MISYLSKDTSTTRHLHLRAAETFVRKATSTGCWHVACGYGDETGPVHTLCRWSTRLNPDATTYAPDRQMPVGAVCNTCARWDQGAGLGWRKYTTEETDR